ncbi:Lipoprotein NlpD [hydrothermal vent metagenome]|uniref:Lipoprotein NlpD n=1 Tax=hydrothermal vent metagenome TaxID=652676 RepID=A0A1W1E065_9ZZZZ
MLKLIKTFVVVFISAIMLISCFSDSSKKRVIVIDKSTKWEKIAPVYSSEHIQAKKSVKKTIKKIAVRKDKSIPVTGKIIKYFSKKHPGIIISTHPGQAVRAIRKGVVVYSEGKIIIIKHPFGFYSSYIQNQTLKVQSGDKVIKGQTIALTGKENFYFEMKKFETPIDPLKYLK